jgi:chitodextrinase
MVLLLIAAILVPTTLAASRGDYSWSTRNTYNDRRAPRPVSYLKVDAADAASVTLDWSRTWDNVGVEGYGVYLDGTRKSETSATSYTFANLVCGRGYTMGVDAFDDAGNRSRTTSTFASTAACGDVKSPTAPANVRTIAATQNQVVLAWTPSTDDFGVVGYSLYVGGFWVGRWSEPSATITNLQCGQTYQIGIDAMDAAGNQSARTSAFFSTSACTTDRTLPTAPTGVTVAKVTATTVTLAWTASSDATGVAEYGLYRDGAKVGAATTTSGDVSGLQCGRTYTLGVDAADAAQNRSPVSTVTAATSPCAPTTPPPPTDSTAPTAPPNLHSTSITQTSDILAWDSSTAKNGMAGYQIFRDDEKIGEGPGVHGGWTNTWKDTGRTCGTRYEYAVAGVDKNGKVGAMSKLAVTTAACDPAAPPPPPPTNPPPPTGPPPADTTAPTKPANLAATTRTATSIALSWQASSDNVGVTGYGVYRGGSRVATASSPTWIVSGLACNTSYTLAVDAVDAAGNRSQQAVVMVSTTACADTQPPTVPTSLAVSNVTQTSAMLGWAASKDNVGVAGYDVMRNGAEVAEVTSPGSQQSGLSCGTPYTLAVVAYDAAGNRSPQAQLVTTTTACTSAPPPPQTPSSGVVELSGTVSASTVAQKIAAAPSGPVTVRPAQGGSATVSGDLKLSRGGVTLQSLTFTGIVEFDPGSSGSKIVDSQAMGFNIFGADNVVVDGNTFDGRGSVPNNQIWDQPAGSTPDGYVIRNNSFRNFYRDDGSHSEALYIGYSTNGTVESNTFDNNGNTGHVFFTWWGSTANASSSYPRNVCVRNNSFGATHGAYFDVNFRAEIPTSANIVVQRDASSTSPQFYGSC